MFSALRLKKLQNSIKTKAYDNVFRKTNYVNFARKQHLNNLIQIKS